MPGRGGFFALEKIKSAKNKLPVIFLALTRQNNMHHEF
jgi:hypothetical protein